VRVAPGRVELAEDYWWRAFQLEESRGNSSMSKHLDQSIGVPADVRVVSGKIRNRQQLSEFAEYRRLVRDPICAGGRANGGCVRDSLCIQLERREQLSSRRKRAERIFVDQCRMREM
jgi:hypothetical protein